MKLIPLTQGLFAKVDDSDYDNLIKWKWCANKKGNTFYALRGIQEDKRTKHILMHREIFNLSTHSKCDIDHIDHDGLNNQRENIRISTHTQNLANIKKKCGLTSKYKGVSRYKKIKWRATIRVNKKQVHLGLFDIEEDAAKAYDTAASIVFGDYAVLNFK